MRKYYLFALILATCPGFMLAECLRGTLLAWPETPETHVHSLFLLEGGNINGIMEDLNRRFPVLLISDADTVELDIIERLHGTGEQQQVLLKPTKVLQAGSTYALEIVGVARDSHIFEAHFLQRYNRQTEAYEPIQWHIVPTKGPAIPVWNQEPVLKEAFASPSGDGILSGFVFDAPFDFPEAILVKVELMDLPSGRIQTHYVMPRKGEILVGKALCRGAFEMVYGARHHIKMRLMDSWGNYSAQTFSPMVLAPEIWGG